MGEGWWEVAGGGVVGSGELGAPSTKLLWPS